MVEFSWLLLENLIPTFIAIFILFMLPVWASKKLRFQQRRPPFQLKKQPSMAPAKKKAIAGTTSTTEPGRNLDGPQPQHEGVNPQMEDINNETASHGDLFDNTENTEAHQLTEAVLKLKALEMKKKTSKLSLPPKRGHWTKQTS